ncbi:MAG: hypothetical protein IKF71_05120 [Bacilli bacterium]|nr:hypothetical protein [Bacilli bacterium]
MKAVKADGLKIEMVDIDYDFLKEQLDVFVKKEELSKADSLRKLLDSLAKEEKKGKKITQDVIEECVNKILDDDFEQMTKLKDQVKDLDQERQVLSLYSKREMDNDTTSTIVSIINNL